ncbi:conserved hypothetical protein [Roseibium sp. TrichSKD4]|uniref:hypothetical protein n=1 Tax=Roseibium sp. TrichSKD4 TaxID=744980 RepID=UPI0001E57383|nr:hypothetical protein [Roseibium sp. TrichSKD4]EFO28572.1 conserved hypothetical protein [Roseibium sp. TrichSKD4]
MMNTYSPLPENELVSVGSIHPDWIEQPGSSFGSEAVVETLLANPRINKKVVEQVLQQNNLLYDDVLDCSPDDALAARLAFQDFNRFTQQVGLVLYGDYLAGSVDPQNLHQLTEFFDIQDLRRAVRLRSLASYQDDMQFDFLSSRGCCLYWKNVCFGLGQHSSLHAASAGSADVFPKPDGRP